MASNKILKIIGGRDALRFGSSEEVLHDGVCVVSKRDLDWAFEAVDISTFAISNVTTNIDSD